MDKKETTADPQGSTHNAPKPVTKVVQKLVKVLEDSGWGEVAKVAARRDEFHPFKPEEVRYEVQGRLTPERALATGCWMPDKLKDECLAVGDVLGVQVVCTADLELVISKTKGQHLLEPSRSSPLIATGRMNVILSWTSFHGDTDVALKGLVDAVHDRRINPQHVRVASIAMDDEPFAAAQKAKNFSLSSIGECLWCGEEGWDSPAAQALKIEESSPVFLLIDASGTCTFSGDLADITDALNSPVSLEDDGVETPRQSTVSDELLEHAKHLIDELNTLRKGRVLTTTRRSLFTFRVGVGASHAEVLQRLIIGGEVFEECDAQVRQQLSRELAGPWLNVCCLTVRRPRPMSAARASCSTCNRNFDARPEYVCLSCDAALCRDCGTTHVKTHPLVVTKHPFQQLERSLFDSKCLFLVEPDTNSSPEEHPDLGCDACFSSLPPQGLRYKNLAKDEHELCEKCFAEALEYSKKSEQEFQEKFNCSKHDCFCMMKTSRGVMFKRMAPTSHQQTSSGPTDFSRGGTMDALAKSPPCGHTSYSWMGNTDALATSPPCGHTAFSWLSSTTC